MKYVTWYQIVDQNGLPFKDVDGNYLPLAPNKDIANQIVDDVGIVTEMGSGKSHKPYIKEIKQEIKTDEATS